MSRFKFKYIEIVYIFILLTILIISCFYLIPGDTRSIGISSDYLDIGDREFYINESDLGYGSHIEGRGNFLFPYILKAITYITSLLGGTQYSYIWNIITISISSILSVASLRLLRLSSNLLFNEKISIIACILYIINPYTYFFALGGGITNYMVIGVTSILYFFCKINSNSRTLTANSNTGNILSITIICIYLSCLRPSGILFSLCILFGIFYKYLSEHIKSNRFQKIKITPVSFLLIGIIISMQNLSYSWEYSIAAAKIFANEGGTFFGYPRELLNDKIKIFSGNIFDGIKSILYLFIWKITDFLSGISDIRDTHSDPITLRILPFLARTSTGILFLYPLNILILIGITVYQKIIIRSNLWILIFASFIAISPSLIGVAMSRYLIMFYTPFLIFGAKIIADIIKLKKSAID